jgi:hypothetical protein
MRLRAKQREALRRRAVEKRSESVLLRDLIDREIPRGFDFDPVRHLMGSVAKLARTLEKKPLAETYSPARLALMRLADSV